MNLGGRPKVYGRTRGIHPDPCPYCPHESELHQTCSSCDRGSHAVCVGSTTSPKHPTEYIPCHCTWVPGTPKEATMPEQDTPTVPFEKVMQEEAARILASFSEFIDFLDTPAEDTPEEAGP